MEGLERKIKTLVAILQSNQDAISTLRAESQSLKEQIEASRSNPDAIYLYDLPPGDDATKVLELVKENRTMNQLLKQYESTLEIIMSKFRAQTSAIYAEKQSILDEAGRLLEQERTENRKLREENLRLTEQLDESTEVIRRALHSMDD